MICLLASVAFSAICWGEDLSSRSPENPDLRKKWFLFQRSYPFQSIPRDARRIAWQQALATPAPGRVSAGPAWRSLGPSPTASRFSGNWGLTSGRINTIAISPADSKIVLIGASTGGIWRSSDGGVNFIPVSDDQVDLAVGSIAFSPSSPATVYAGMGDPKQGYVGSGVLKSMDAGQSWVRVNDQSLPSPGEIARIVVDPTNASLVYVAQRVNLDGGTRFASGFYRSINGGVSWVRTVQGPTEDLALNPNDPQMLYLGISRVDGGSSLPAGVLRSLDGGQSWESLYATPFDSTTDVKVGITQADPNLVYVYIGGFSGGVFDIRVEVSTDGGASFVNRGRGALSSLQFGYNTFISVDPTNANVVYVGTPDLFKSTDGGLSWTNLTNNYSPSLVFTPADSATHVDQHALCFIPGDAHAFFLGNDGGLSRSTDGGQSFQSFNSSLSLTQFYAITAHPNDPLLTYGGAQDNGILRRTVDSGFWKEMNTGDGGRPVINAEDQSMVFTNYVGGRIDRWSENGNRFEATLSDNSTFGEPPFGGRMPFIAPFAGNGVDKTLYFGTWRLFVSTDLGDNWTKPGGDDVLSEIRVSPSDSKVIYTGSERGRAMVSTDGGQNWTDITVGLPDRFITSVNVHPSSSATAYLTVSGYGSGHVFKTTDTGATWNDMSANLPDVPSSAFLMDPSDPDSLFVGTDIGVFRSTDAGASWAPFNQGMPPVIVNDFAVSAAGRIIAGTYGRGAYELATDEFEVTLSADNGISRTSLGEGGTAVGYGELTATTPALPMALANFGLTSVDDGALITEAGIGVSTLTKNVRMFVDFATETVNGVAAAKIGNPINGGVAVVNPGATKISVRADFKDPDANDITSGNIDLEAGAHSALFATQIVSDLGDQFLGTLTLSSADDFVAVNLSSATNKRQEILFSALPVANLDAAALAVALIFPQIVDGGGFPTQILLMSASGTVVSTGRIDLFDGSGNALALDFGSGPQSSLQYSINPNGMVKFETTGLGPLQAGYAVVTPTAGPSPIGSAIFSIIEGGGFSSQAGVPSVPLTTNARLFVEVSSSPLFRNTGIAVVIRSGAAATINVTLVGFDGSTRVGKLEMGANGHRALFVDQLFDDLPPDLQGVLTMTSATPFSPLTLRLTINQRGDSIYSTLPVADLTVPLMGRLFIPQFVNGGGYQTQIIGLNTTGAAGTLHFDFFNSQGATVILLFR